MPTHTPATSYDLVPYPPRAFPQTHPDVLATVATLLGISPPPVEAARVLELGCGSGGNLIPMAEAMPRRGSWGSTCRGGRSTPAARWWRR